MTKIKMYSCPYDIHLDFKVPNLANLSKIGAKVILFIICTAFWNNPLRPLFSKITTNFYDYGKENRTKVFSWDLTAFFVCNILCISAISVILVLLSTKNPSESTSLFSTCQIFDRRRTC